MHLLDVNLWLALAFEVHVHHRRAAEWFQQAARGSCTFCRFTQQGLLRLATNPSVFGDDALTMRQAWACYDQLSGDDRVVFADEPDDIQETWRMLTHRRRYSHRVWSDAYLVAFARNAHIDVATFDKGFKEYTGLRVTIL